MESSGAIGGADGVDSGTKGLPVAINIEAAAEARMDWDGAISASLPGGGGRMSESAATVRGLPPHVLEELERIQDSQQLSAEGDPEDEDDGEESEASEGTALSINSIKHQPQPQQPPQFQPHAHQPLQPSQATPPPFLMPTSVANSTTYPFLSMPTSPRLDGADSSALPSPPSSPSESVSSLPSVSSSFFFSSAAASPRMPSRPLSEHEHEHEQARYQDHDHDHDHDHDRGHEGDAEEHGREAGPSAHPGHRRRRTLRPKRSLESAFSSLESSPSSLELFIGTSGVGRGSSRGRGGVRYSRRAGAAGESNGHDATSGLVIPSLMLPPALKRPTPYGQTLGEVRLLVLARQGAAPGGRGFLTTLLLEDNDDIVEVGEWEDPVPISLMASSHMEFSGEKDEQELGLEGLDEEMLQLGKAGAKVLKASTDWIEHTDAHGLEKFEPMRNVEVVELPGYDALTDGATLVTNLKNIIHGPFNAVSDVLHPDSQPSAVLANLVGSASTPLFTALVLLLPSSLTSLDRHIVDSLGAHIPIIVLPASAASSASASSSYPVSSSSSFSSSFPASRHSPVQTQPTHAVVRPTLPTFAVKRASTPLVLSSFRPHNAIALKHGLFHSPETLAALRMEAAARFLRWREVDRVVRGLHTGVAQRLGEASGARILSRKRESLGLGWRGWDKEKWEREWMTEFSRDVAVGMREMTSVNAQQAIQGGSEHRGVITPPPSAIVDMERGGREWNGDLEADEKHTAPRIIAYTHSHSFDPLHFPSLFLLTVSMLGPLKTRVVEAVKNVCRIPFKLAFSSRSLTTESTSNFEGSEKNLDMVRVHGYVQTIQPPTQTQRQKWVAVGGLVGVGFCVGVGVGVVVAGGAD